MNIRNRIQDVIQLRCNICQDFLKLIIPENWKEKLYMEAKQEITSNGRYEDKYRPVYEKMRDIGINNYRIEDMDISIIAEIIYKWSSGTMPTQKITRVNIDNIRNSRNLKSHSSENEGDEELYLQGLLELCYLKKFVKEVDRYETDIEDDLRLIFRKTSLAKIDELTNILDNERIANIQQTKEIEKDIERILEANDEKQRRRLWCDVSDVYIRRSFYEKDYEFRDLFFVEASAAGIREADGYALSALFNPMRDEYSEGEKKLYQLYESSDISDNRNYELIIEAMNSYLITHDDLTEGMKKLITLIGERGRVVRMNERGILELQ